MSASVAARVGQAEVSQKELNEKFEGLKIILKNIKSNKSKFYIRNKRIVWTYFLGLVF